MVQIYLPLMDESWEKCKERAINCTSTFRSVEAGGWSLFQTAFNHRFIRSDLELSDLIAKAASICDDISLYSICTAHVEAVLMADRAEVLADIPW